MTIDEVDEVEEPSSAVVDAPRSPVPGAPAVCGKVCGLGGRRLARTQAGDSWHWWHEMTAMYDDAASWHVCASPSAPGCVRPRDGQLRMTIKYGE
jgi:hypothetical protein